MKVLQDTKLRGGMGMPDWFLYYKAAALVWIKDWIMLENQRILKLEGHDLKWGWQFDGS